MERQKEGPKFFYYRRDTVSNELKRLIDSSQWLEAGMKVFSGFWAHQFDKKTILITVIWQPIVCAWAFLWRN